MMGYSGIQLDTASAVFVVVVVVFAFASFVV